MNRRYKGEFITANMAKHGASLPTQGDAKLVVFYVDFPDCRYDYEPTLDELNQISFGTANEASACYPFESFSAFYGRASKGSMNRIIDDTNTDNFYHTGDTVTGSISGFHWYDANGGQTVDTGFSIEIGEVINGVYTVTIRK